MNNVVYNAEQSYQRDVAEYTALRHRQLGMFDLDPTEQEIFDEIVDRLIKESLWRACQGKTLQRLDVFMSIFTNWFGQIANKHLNAALNAMRRPTDGRIIAATSGITKRRQHGIYISCAGG